MSHLDTLRAIQDVLTQSRYAEARNLIYRAVVEEQKRIADQQNNAPEATPGR